ncbi:MAG: 16S rRNA (guanine(527)-N(7))-methyltransferase RsmG [Pseudomonadota bacterium]
MNPELALTQGTEQLGIKLTPEASRQILDYLALLCKWNKVYSLTAIEPEQMISHHVLDSLAVLPHLWPGNWLDVGCGPGLPGLILALVRPEWQFTLLDSNGKKTSFVQQTVIELGLLNVRVCQARVEAWRNEEKFDGVISRAFADVSEFTRLTKHLLGKNGGWAAMKGDPKPELTNLPAGVRMEKIIQLDVPGLNAARSLVILKATNA